MEDNLGLSLSNPIDISEWSIEENNAKLYNGYSIFFTIEDDVLEGTILTLFIKTKITDFSERELENYTLSVEIESKEIVVTMEELV